jgi:hypothetical protein
MSKNTIPSRHECPVCHEKYDFTGKEEPKALQHHLWGGHHLEVIRSHEVAKKIHEKRITEPEMAELRQMMLAGIA